jgi:hypothetical protein
MQGRATFDESARSAGFAPSGPVTASSAKFTDTEITVGRLLRTNPLHSQSNDRHTCFKRTSGLSL